MKISGRQTVVMLVAGGLLGALGCAHSFPPPRELVEARAAYARAEKGPAAQMAPARLKLAKQALNSAELSYGGAPESEVRDRAYIAVRRAEAAEAEAEADMARQRRERALRELASLSGVHAEKARAELAAAGVQIDQANQQATSERQRADEESRRAQEANTNLDVRAAGARSGRGPGPSGDGRAGTHGQRQAGVARSGDHAVRPGAVRDRPGHAAAGGADQPGQRRGGAERRDTRDRQGGDRRPHRLHRCARVQPGAVAEASPGGARLPGVPRGAG